MSRPVFELEDLFSKSSGVPGVVLRVTLPLFGRLAALFDQAAGQEVVDDLLFAAWVLVQSRWAGESEVEVVLSERGHDRRISIAVPSDEFSGRWLPRLREVRNATESLVGARTRSLSLWAGCDSSGPKPLTDAIVARIALAPDRTELTLDFDPAVMEASQAATLLTVIHHVGEQLAAQPNVLLSGIEILPPAMRRRVLAELNPPSVRPDVTGSVPATFRRCAEKQPSAVAISFGDENVTFATAVHGRGSNVGCLLFNAGVIHRVGPHRINVKLARALSAAGIPSLRMDLAGLGDSATSRVSIGVQAQALRDLQDGISALKTFAGVDAVIVVGICSGAVSAYDLAQVDERVHGLLMFDGYTFPTLLTHLRRRWRRLMSWRISPEGVLRSFRRDNAEPQLDPLTTPPELKPSRQQFGDAIERFVARGVALHIVYSGSFLEQHNYSRQLDHAFRGAHFLRHIRHSYLPSIDHTLTPLAAQRTFLKLVVDWASDATKSYRSSLSTTP